MQGKRIIAFLLDIFILCTLIELTYPHFLTLHPFLKAGIQYIFTVLLMAFIIIKFDRTPFMGFLGLRIKWNKRKGIRGVTFSVFPYLCFFGIPFIWAIESHLNEFIPDKVWLRLPREEIEYFQGITLLQNMVVGLWVLMIIIPLWLRKKGFGWEILGDYEVVEDFKIFGGKA